jgi:RsiW-degrading membrane proteinase PrsW (M82 family)
MVLLIISIAPVFIILVYIYFRDKYEKEPVGLLLKGLLFGAIIMIPILAVETLLQKAGRAIDDLAGAAYTAFVVAAFTEELFKFLAVYILIWRNKNFNEKFDGIVYAVFVSLGFAAVENIFYVFEYGSSVGFIRAVTSVPAHALFGIYMGFYLGIAKFFPERRISSIRKALLVPILFHGIYDFLLLSEHPILLLLFFPFLIVMWWLGFRRMKQQISTSRFKSKNTEVDDQIIDINESDSGK